MTRKRTHVYACKLCKRWIAVPNATAQRFAQRRGACMDCCADPQWRERVYVRVIELHMDRLVALGGSLPENKRAVFRRLYRKRQRAWARAKALLEEVEV